MIEKYRPRVVDRLGAFYHPAGFQGAHRRRGYFEGWYFKCVGPGGSRAPGSIRPGPPASEPPGPQPAVPLPPALAVIPGVSRADDGKAHSFVQVLRPGGFVRYFSYALREFRYRPDRFAIRVGPNEFDGRHLSLDLPADEHGPAIRGEVRFGPWRPWPVTLPAPGIMGWYRYAPYMECYHGVLSLDHALDGELWIGDERQAFSGGRGYVEKDWGTSFPSSWVWSQSNHFERAGVSCTLSVARIPWRGSSFTGHIAGLLLDGTLHRFATYTGSRLLEVTTHRGGARIVIADCRLELQVELEGATAGALKAPVLGAMQGRSDEALDGSMSVRLLRRDGRESYAGRGGHAGVEIMNDRGELAAD